MPDQLARARIELEYAGQPGPRPDPPSRTSNATVRWGQIVDAPTVFPPAPHRHPVTDVDGVDSAVMGAMIRTLGRVVTTAYCRAGVWERRGPGGALAGRTDVTVLWIALAPSDPPPLTGGVYAVAGHDLWVTAGAVTLVASNPVVEDRVVMVTPVMGWDVQLGADPGRVAMTTPAMGWDVQLTPGVRAVMSTPAMSWDVQLTDVVPPDPLGQWVIYTRSSDCLSLTETGTHNAMDTTGGANPTPPDIAAEGYPRVLAEMALLERTGRKAMGRICFYMLRDMGVSNTDEQQRFGFLNRDASPKAHFNTVKQWHHILDRGMGSIPATAPKLSYSWATKPASVREVLYYAAPGSGERQRHYLLVWRKGNAWRWDPDKRVYLDVANVSATITFGSTKTVRVFSPTDSESVVSTTTGKSVTLSLGSKLLILEVTSATADTTGQGGSSVANLRYLGGFVHKIREDSDAEWTQNLAKIQESGVKTIRSRLYSSPQMAARIKQLRDIGVKVIGIMGTPTTQTDTPEKLIAWIKSNGLLTYRGDGCFLTLEGANEWNHYGDKTFDQNMADLLAHTQKCWTLLRADSAFNTLPFGSPTVGLRHVPTYEFLAAHTNLWDIALVHLYLGGYEPFYRVFDSPQPQYPYWAALT